MYLSKRSAVFSSTFFVLILLCSFNSVQAFQDLKDVNLSQIYLDIIESQDETLYYEDINIIDDVSTNRSTEDPSLFITALKTKLGIEIPLDSMGIISKVKNLFLDASNGKTIPFVLLNLDLFQLNIGRYEVLNFQDMHVDTMVVNKIIVSDTFRIEHSKFVEFSDIEGDYNNHHIYNSEYAGYYNMFYANIHREFKIMDSRFKEGAHIGPHFEGTFTDFFLSNTTFEAMDSALPLFLEDVSPDSTIYKTQVAFNMFGALNSFSIIDNTFLSNEGFDEQFIYVQGGFDNLSILGNTFESQVYLQCKVNVQFDFLENESTGNLILSDFILDGKNNEIHWRQFDGFKFAAASIVAGMFTDPDEGYDLSEDHIDRLFRQTSNFAIKTYRGISDEELEDEDLFQRLISSYYRIYKVFKDNGQITDANQTYVEMKDVQLRQLRFKYTLHGGLENLIQWRLNQLLRFYTDYGTNPSRAIRISIFVVVLFSVFYFFFPSEWDTKSKKQLLADYKIFIKKNEHGYFKPFIKLSSGFSVSLINAMTLSLNSFVTLGFGSIPTTGLARYICILQGFIGWFLLSVFTASLINQVLF